MMLTTDPAYNANDRLRKHTHRETNKHAHKHRIKDLKFANYRPKNVPKLVSIAISFVEKNRKYQQ